MVDYCPDDFSWINYWKFKGSNCSFLIRTPLENYNLSEPPLVYSFIIDHTLILNFFPCFSFFFNITSSIDLSLKQKLIYVYSIPVCVTEGRYLVQEKGMSSMNQVHTVIKRQLIGSVPPSCRARCGQCQPCRPVQVAIQPGKLVPMEEYYPIVWRCQCSNKLFLP